MVTDGDRYTAGLDSILDRYARDPNALLQVLREVQELRGYIHPSATSYISVKLGIPRAQTEGVAGFYSFLHLQPHGEYRVLFSDNITDRMLGSQSLMEQMCQQLWLQPGKVSEDGLVSIDTTSCTGMCDQGPAMLVNNIAINRLTPARIDRICGLIRERVPLSAWPAEFFVIEDNIRRKDILLHNDYQPGASLAALLARGTLETLQAIKT